MICLAWWALKQLQKTLPSLSFTQGTPEKPKVFFIWLLHLTTFCALLTLDAQRQAAKRLDPFLCVAASRCLPAQATEDKQREPLGEALAAMIRLLTGLVS